jgi:hypothetical protein
MRLIRGMGARQRSALMGRVAAVHHGPLQGVVSTSSLRSAVRDMLEACQSVRVRYYAMLHVQVPRCRKVCNDFCGGGGTAFLEGRIRRPVIFKPDANQLRSGVQFNRGLAELRMYRST